MVKSCVRSSLGKYNVAPTIDFEQESSFDLPPIKAGTTISAPTIKVNPDYNPFQKQNTDRVEENLDLLKSNFQTELIQLETGDRENTSVYNFNAPNANLFIQFKKRYLLTVKKKGIIIVDIFRAHQQIKYEELINHYENAEVIAQKLLHPLEVDLSSSDIQLCRRLKMNY